MLRFIKNLFCSPKPHAVDKSMTVFPMGTNEEIYKEVLKDYILELESRIDLCKSNIRYHSKKEAYESLRLHVMTEVLAKLKERS